MRSMYIYDYESKIEYWGAIEPETSEQEDETGITTTISYIMEILYKYPLGYMLAEFISVDENQLITIVKETDDEVFNGPYITNLLNLPFVSFPEDFLVSRDSIIRLANYIAIFRRFIDICRADSKRYNFVYVNALIALSDVYDMEPEVYAFIDFTPSIGQNKWTEKYQLPESYNYLHSHLDFDSLNPSENSNQLPFLLDNEVGYAAMPSSSEHAILAIERTDDMYGNFMKTLLNLVSANIYINKCPNCGKYFVPVNRSDTVYCDRNAPQDQTKTCKEYGARQAWQKTLRESEVAGLCRKIYMAKQMLAKRNPNEAAYLEAFEWFKAESKKWKADCKSGAKTEEEFIVWLHEARERKVL